MKMLMDMMMILTMMPLLQVMTNSARGMQIFATMEKGILVPDVSLMMMMTMMMMTMMMMVMMMILSSPLLELDTDC